MLRRYVIQINTASLNSTSLLIFLVNNEGVFKSMCLSIVTRYRAILYSVLYTYGQITANEHKLFKYYRRALQILSRGYRDLFWFAIQVSRV